MKIKNEEINYLQIRRRDKIGELFEYQGKILRGIFPQAANMVRGFFTSGFVPELIEKNLFPDTWITDYTCGNYDLIVEHKRIWPIIYPQEWSFSMLKDAALTVIKVAQVARRYNYNMSDCHGYNILIDRNNPKFIDLGSFHTCQNGVTGWEAYEEFLRFYYYPLCTWKDGLEYTSKLSIFSANLTPHVEHLMYHYPFLRPFSPELLSRFIKVRFLLSNLCCRSPDELKQKQRQKSTIGRSGLKLLKFLADHTNLAGSKNLACLEKRIKSIKRKHTSSPWKNYYTGTSQKMARFDRIIHLVNKFCPDIKTAIDMGGNCGFFAEKILEMTPVEKIICQDMDEQAIDSGYNAHKNSRASISYVHFNAIAPIVKITYPMPWERFCSDIVFALALLHHLILTQGFALKTILQELAKYTNKYICVEFMPKGLWVHSDGSKITVPGWYTTDWFRQNFTKYFTLLTEEIVGENYIVFLGRKKGI